MKIGELVKRSGLTASRIRFYGASGLFKAVDRKSNGYRDYGPEAVWILEVIATAQAAGFSLDEIKELLQVGPNEWQHDKLVDVLKGKIAEIESLQKRLEQNKAQLLLAISSIENRPEGLTCADNRQLVLDRLREDSPTLIPKSKTDVARSKPTGRQQRNSRRDDPVS